MKTKYNEAVARETMQNLSNFNADTKLRTASLTFIVTHFATKKEIETMKLSFNQIDENGDGMISKPEFIKAYKKLHPDKDEAGIEERALMVFSAADMDGNGEIDFDEWCTATINKNELLNDKNLKAAFALFDKDGGGTIEAAEVASILGNNMSKEEQVW